LKKTILILIIALIALHSCKKNSVSDCFYNTGSITSEYRIVKEFNSILIRDNVNLILTQSDTSGIRVEAGSNLIDGIETNVNESGVLEIRNVNGCNWIRSFENPLNVYLNYKKIDSIEYRSIGDITTTNTMQSDGFWLNVQEGAGEIKMDLSVRILYCALNYGTSDIILSGECDLSYVYSASFGLINLADLETVIVFANNRSSNDVYLNATETLGVDIGNIGNIYYKGNPINITIEKTGTGSLIKLPD
jgi:uncharacterized protein (UPF0218 family)